MSETTNNVGGIAADRLRSIIERVERLFTEMAYSRQLAEDRDALLAQNCRLRAQRDDALARRRRDAKGRFR